jgi:prepilin-type N-terminal cleavage/methylation domain-containing protein
MKSISISNCAIKRSTRGFSLTELAIVLGVIGLILASIWALATQSWESMRQERLKEEIFNTVKSVRAYYQNQNGISGAFAVLTPVLIGQKVIAGDMVRTGGACANAGPPAGVCADHPWGDTTAAIVGTGSFGICAWLYNTTTNCTAGIGAAAGTPEQYFAIELEGMPQDACIAAVMNNSGADAPVGLYDIYITGNSMLAAGGFPVKAGTAQGNCAVGVNNTIDFVYRLVAPQS